MRRLTPDELRFALWFELGRLPKSLLKELAGADRTKRERAQDLAASQIAVRFERHEVLAPDPLPDPIDRTFRRSG
jgi:hypothetical protein